MNEDEAFVRAIVDGPGDDTPRLVYADWLDDRADPRGPYLRAEREWGRAWRDGRAPGDASALRALAAGLDPVWVARVSRAPVGVCFETKLLVHDHPPATAEAVDALAAEFGVVFPPEYRAFLLNYNGGWLSTPGEEYFPEADETFGDVAGVAEFARYVFANCHEGNRRCGLFPVAGTAGASGMNTMLGVEFVGEQPNRLFGRLFSVAGHGEEELWVEGGAFVEVEDWDREGAESLPELFAEWEQEAVYRTGAS